MSLFRNHFYMYNDDQGSTVAAPASDENQPDTPVDEATDEAATDETPVDEATDEEEEVVATDEEEVA